MAMLHLQAGIHVWIYKDLCLVLHVTHAICTPLILWVIVTCIGMSAEIALCLLA